MIATLAVLAAVVPVVLLLAVYTAEVLAGLRRAVPTSAPLPGDAWPRTAVLVPAHDEAAGIGAMLAALAIPAHAPVEVLVVADNCTDDTARRAAAAGARVVERHDPERRGKGFALAFGRDVLAADPPACVVVLDADCVMADDGLHRLARDCVAQGRPVQSCYLLRADPAAPPVEQLSTFAFLVKNLVRQRGTMRIGGVAALTGSGMAVPWAAFRDAPLASDDLVEDLALGVWLARHGWPPRFLAEVRTWSDPVAGADLLVQRSRWEHGFLATARHRALPLVGAGLARQRRALVWLGLHLLVPPLALLCLAGGIATVVALLAAMAGAGWGPFVLVAGALLAAGGAPGWGGGGGGGVVVSAGALLRVPRYVAAKLPIYRALAGGRRDGWVRSRRPGEPRR